MKKLVIIGASGHGKVVFDIAKENGYDKIVFLDDSIKSEINPKVVGTLNDVDKFSDYDFFVAVGDNSIRRTIANRLQDEKLKIVSLISKHAVISPSAKVGIGSVVMPGSVVNAEAVIGNGVILNTASSVDHNCAIGDFSHISVGTHLAGTVKLGENVFACCGSTVINNLKICNNVIIGAGATVIRDIEESGTYVGVPAKKIK